MYPETGEVKEICDKFIHYLSSAIHTDFRQSPLRIDLDANNSSGHRTAGYYDRSTTCTKEAPVMDEDVELYTCGAEVDYISFRFRYYDSPRLSDERIYSEGFADSVQTSPRSIRMGEHFWNRRRQD